jgi:hypothetical protein
MPTALKDLHSLTHITNHNMLLTKAKAVMFAAYTYPKNGKMNWQYNNSQFQLEVFNADVILLIVL